jgi:hypothetical protein
MLTGQAVSASTIKATGKAPEILRSEAYLAVRCNDEG